MAAPSESDPEIIYENKDFLVLNKPAGLMVHAAKISARKKIDKPKEPTLADWLVKHYPEIKTVGDDPALRPGIVHRLDKDTSGVMVVARNQKTFEYLKALFQKHEIQKTYLALVRGKPKKESGVIDAPIGIKSGTLKRSIHSAKMAKEAVTEYRTLTTFGDVCLLEVKPKTGRTHQIRVHLASIGCPIVGDRLYGPKRRQADPSGRLMLHARAIEFTDQRGRRVKFEAEPPWEFADSLVGAVPPVIHRPV